MSKHLEFIKKPITDIIDEAISSCSGINDGIETFPLGDYVMHSLFLKMTGFQEQKMKCIAWDMATEDFEYRRKLLYGSNYGEYSDYKSKKDIYSNLIKLIQKLDKGLNIQGAYRTQLLKESENFVTETFKGTVLSRMKQKEFDFFCNFIKTPNNKLFDIKQICPDDKNIGAFNHIFQSELRDFYTDSLYKQRNRLAHNTLSYQNNLPTLNLLLEENYDQDNYFVWFTVLIIIDKIFIDLFSTYLDLLDSAVY
ncbi:hypothetical protein [Lactococcus petauri]|uniref:Uncharacterized protein n=1 Tax=Lactococcus petauri TaxID=1940789 RepID=A0A252CAS6_9LACT|nr:hypothetical protein [Lactococcus petauri]OUK02858.1 hypothetical protein BZZ03_10510 [Lactococcus petauri]